MRYYWGTTSSESYGKGSSTLISSIQPQVSKIDWDRDASGQTINNQYTVKANETFYILAPGYTTTTSYGNYFYMTSTVGLTKDTPIKLDSNQYIYIYEERPSGDSVSPTYTIGEGAIVRCNVTVSAVPPPFMVVEEPIPEVAKPSEIADDASQEERDAYQEALDKYNKYLTSVAGQEYLKKLEKYTIYKTQLDRYNSYKYHTNKPINMGSNITLEILGPDEYKLKNTYPSTTDKGIKIATNAIYLINALKDTTKSSYTLNVGEYLLWTNVLADENTPITEVGVVGEGNTLSWTAPLVTEDSSFTAISADNINASDYSKYSWLLIKNEALTYRTNTLYSFGENKVLKFTTSPWAKYLPDRIFDLNKEVTISYATQTDPDTRPADEDYETIPAILDNDHYQAFVGLSLVLSPNKIQKLETNQQVILNKGTTIENKYIQSNSTLVYAGGQPLTLSALESSQLTLSALVGTITTSTDVDTFIDNKNEKGEPYTLPNKSILYASKSNGSVSYYIGKGELANGTQVGFAYELKANAEYWNIKDQQLKDVPKNSTNLSTDTDINYLYNANYSPVYQPSESDLIENPLDPVSFFKSSHVCNKFVLPRLRGVDGEQETDPLKGLTIRS